MKVFCLFEQSGTFKNEFKKLGIEAEDYDILNDFGETDHIVDLYAEIEGGYEGKPSIFDTITKEDLIMAFFPCIRFENQIMLWFRGDSKTQRKWNNEEKIAYDIKLMEELAHNYILVNKLFTICYRKGLQMVFENPFSEEHFLRRYWCISPSVIDKDRTERGDYFVKPTQYWFVNREPRNNPIFEVTKDNSLPMKNALGYATGKRMGMNISQKVARSMIHPDYANRFIREFIL